MTPPVASAAGASQYFQNVLDFVGLHPWLAIAAAFLVSLCEALPIIGLFAPSGVVLVGVGGLIGVGV
jgi:membrane protein DedA with SNARE-associated domain